MNRAGRHYLQFIDRLLLLSLLWLDPSQAGSPPRQAISVSGLYETRKVHDPNGIGKFYMGREIARVMGHEAAPWLERPDRIAQEKPDQLVEALRIKPGQVVADIGAGTGYLSRRIAAKVGLQGRVLAVDIQPEMLDQLVTRMSSLGISNVTSVLGTVMDPKLSPGSVDLVLMADVYHEFEYPREMMESLCRSLKPGGRVAFVEYRAEDPAVPIKAVHKMTEAQVRKEMSVLPLDWVETIKTLPWQHLIVFRKPG